MDARVESFSSELLQLGNVVAVGTDVIEVVRIERALARTGSFVDRVFTAEEQAYCFSAKGSTATERFAVRFAAKEAVFKALGVGLGQVGFKDVEVVRQPSGQPTLALSGRAETISEKLGCARWLVSLSHSKTVAQAVVVGLNGAGNAS